MTLPRTLHLVKTSKGLRVRSQLVDEVDRLVEASTKSPILKAGQAMSLSSLDSNGRESALRYAFDVQGNSPSPISIRLENQSGEFVDIEIDQQRSLVSLNRSHSGETSFNEHFGKVQKAELTTTSDSYNVTIIVDRSSLELFIDNGTTVMTALVFPKTVYETLHVAPNSQSIHQLSIDRLGSVWSSN
tara:strand:- start:64 stop:624 length:561 start_codon:yes stop_codon:yes gene_type:complete